MAHVHAFHNRPKEAYFLVEEVVDEEMHMDSQHMDSGAVAAVVEEDDHGHEDDDMDNHHTAR